MGPIHLSFSRCIILYLACLLATSFGRADAQSAQGAPLYKQANAPIEARISDLLQRMTLEEKARQLDMYSAARYIVDKHTDDTHAALDAAFLPEKAQSLWGDLGVGSIHDLNPTPEQANAIQRWVIAHNRLGIPALFIEEGLHGFDTGTVFPAPINLAATWNPQIGEQTGAAIAAEARATGVDMILGPVLDLAREPRWGRVEEDFGEDPYLTGQLALAYVRGAQGDSLDTDHTVVSEPKHFAGHGSPEGRHQHIARPHRRARAAHGHAEILRARFSRRPRHGDDGRLSRDRWHSRHRRSAAAEDHPAPGVGLSGICSLRPRRHPAALQRDHVAASPKDASCLAIRSGVDMQFYDFPHDVFQKALIDCVREGSLPQSDLDRAVRSVLRVKFALGLFDHPFVDPALNARVHRSQPHLAFSLDSARQSMTLLKNDGHLLPLSKSLRHIAVIGPNADVARYGDYERESNGKRISLLDGIRAIVPQAAITFDPGKDIAAAVAAAKQADAVILGLGERQGISGEGFDRSNLDLPGNQEQLLEVVVATGKPAILVLENGRPLTIGWAKQHVPAILEAWYPGEFGGQAIAETLFGDNNPAGRLTITFPRSVGQLPDFYNSDPSRIHKYVDDDGKPIFPFGFGLSYSTFRYDHLAVQPAGGGSGGPVKVSVDVTNAGDREGDEVVQLYFRENVTSVETPSRSLAGFSRIHLRPQETKTVTFSIRQSQLAVERGREVGHRARPVHRVGRRLIGSIADRGIPALEAAILPPLPSSDDPAGKSRHARNVHPDQPCSWS
jgi:beta-glucosidase